MVEKVIEGHPEGRTKERRAWTQLFHLMERINEALKGDDISRSERNKLLRRARSANAIREKYDGPQV